MQNICNTTSNKRRFMYAQAIEKLLVKIKKCISFLNVMVQELIVWRRMSHRHFWLAFNMPWKHSRSKCQGLSGIRVNNIGKGRPRMVAELATDWWGNDKRKGLQNLLNIVSGLDFTVFFAFQRYTADIKLQSSYLQPKRSRKMCCCSGGGEEAVGKDRKLFLIFWVFPYFLPPIIPSILKYS